MATNQIFVNPYNKDPLVWNSQGATIAWSTGESSADGTQIFQTLTGLTIQYTRPVTTQYPIGGSAPLQIIGAPQGTCDIQSLLGPQKGLKAFIKAAGNVCKPITITIKPFSQTTNSSECKSFQHAKHTITLKGCVMQSFGYTIQQGQGGIAIIRTPIRLSFTDLQWSE